MYLELIIYRNCLFVHLHVIEIDHSQWMHFCTKMTAIIAPFEKGRQKSDILRHQNENLKPKLPSSN